MANRTDNQNVQLISELLDVEQTLKNAKMDLEAELNKQVFIDRKKQAEALMEYTAQLEGVSEKKKQQLQIQFLKDYEAVRVAEERRQIRERFVQERRAQIEAYKGLSQQAENERKKQNKQLDRELEVAKLRSKYILDAEGKVVKDASGNQVEKSGIQKVLDSVKADFRENSTMMSKSLTEAGGRIFRGLVNIGDRLSGEVNAVISTFAQYQSDINTRLQGTAATFQTVQKNLTSNIGTSPFVKTSSVLESLNELVAQGIAFNIEQRAFLDSLGDKIATTFDIANSSLLRIVKLQQEDSSASRLGMEAYLTRFFNNMFQDTQYLSQTFDSVTEALLEATSQMGTKQSVEFEYIVQKWLGSLSAVGTSESTVRSLAEAIGYLGAGNVTALNASNMQSLLVMAASRAGLDYSSILTDGLNAYNTNSLLNAVVGYMQEIGQGTNKVVKSQFAQTFGLSISDLTAVKNISMDMDAITKSMMSYQGTIQEVGYQLNQITSRVSEAQKVQNVISNVKFAIGTGIAESPVLSSIWAITDLIQSVTGGIAIPAISVFGNMVDLNTTVENLMKTGLIGISTLGKIPDIYKGLSQAGNFSGMMSAFRIGEPAANRTRGTGLVDRSSGMSTSQAVYVGTGDSSGIVQYETLKATEPARRKLEEEQEKQKTTTDIHAYLVDTLNPQIVAMVGSQDRNSQIDQKMSNDVLNYLVFLLDPKITSMVQLLGSMSGFKVNTGQFQSTMVGTGSTGTAPESENEKANYLLNYGTSVTVSEPAQTNASKNYERLEEIALDVSGIHALLKNGITVNVSNIASFLGSTGTSLT
jgi:hypothetical protein